MRKYVVVIPCRLNSKRLKNKLLKKVNDKEIFLHTFYRCSLATDKKNIFIATDSKKIFNICKDKNINVVKTSKKPLTGSDRIREFSKKINAKNYINVQGDEPIINPKNIRKVIDQTAKKSDVVYNCYSEIKYKEAQKDSIPKVVFNEKKELIYISRSIIPFNHSKNFVKYYKQICIYSFPKKVLKYFGNKKGLIEKNEDIEILRLIENGVKVKMIKVRAISFAIDTLQDYNKFKKITKKQFLNF